jgi:hypothetical protein
MSLLSSSERKTKTEKVMVLIYYLHKGIQAVLAHTDVLEEVYFDTFFLTSFCLLCISLVPLGGVKGQRLQLRRHRYVSAF